MRAGRQACSSLAPARQQVRPSQVVEDLRGLLPGLDGGWEVTGSLAGVAELGHHASQHRAGQRILQAADQGRALAVTAERRAWLAEPGVGHIHLHLWVEGYRQIPTDGPLFLLGAVAGSPWPPLLAWPRPLAGLAAVGYIASDIGAMLISLAVGLFGFRESISASYVTQTLAIETITLLALLTWTVPGRGHPGPPAPRRVIQPATVTATREPPPCYDHPHAECQAGASSPRYPPLRLRPPASRLASGRRRSHRHRRTAEPRARRPMSLPLARVRARAPGMRGHHLLIGDQAGDLHPEARESSRTARSTTGPPGRTRRRQPRPAPQGCRY